MTVKEMQRVLERPLFDVYQIFYWVPTANGGTDLHEVMALDKEECEMICSECEKLGYKIEMVN